MKKIKMIVLMVFVTASLVQAGSIWANRKENMKNIYADDTARQVGDIITIIIAEDHKTGNKVKRDLLVSTCIFKAV